MNALIENVSKTCWKRKKTFVLTKNLPWLHFTLPPLPSAHLLSPKMGDVESKSEINKTIKWVKIKWVAQKPFFFKKRLLCNPNFGHSNYTVAKVPQLGPKDPRPQGPKPPAFSRQTKREKLTAGKSTIFKKKQIIEN